MEGEWNEITLGEFVTLQRGHDLPEHKREQGEIPILGSFGITGWHNTHKAQGPGVTVGRSGVSFGIVNYSPVDFWPLNTALYVKDFHGNDPYFAFYFLKSIDFTRFNSGSAQPSLNRNHIHPIPIRIPDLTKQKAIAHILGSLDEKIELNRQMNETLEAIAQALFKSWFVDFDPVIDNAIAAGKVKRLKAAYDICSGSESLSEIEKEHIHFYLAIRSILFKLTKGDAPDTAQMNSKVREMIKDALQSDGVEEIFKIGTDQGEIDIFDQDYLTTIQKIKLPNTKIKLLQKLLAQAIREFKKVNKTKGTDFSKKFQALVEKYNQRNEQLSLSEEGNKDFENLEDISLEILDLYQALRIEMGSFSDLGIGFEEKAFYDILKSLMQKYDFTYPDDKLIDLSKAIKTIVDDKAKYTDWSQRYDIKAELKVDLIMLLAKFGYPPVDRDEVYKEIFEQAENFKKNQSLKTET